ncbi:MAG: ABC transporter ATP-binding protein [Anaerolineaceae bacterium]|jgi:ABC-2 type transport system ATP-binding protein/lipopolysaccharide transport system ATP-binding protein|nr:ABC transporter ATP-binding protein [Anaerolineaceae bacterium]
MTNRLSKSDADFSVSLQNIAVRYRSPMEQIKSFKEFAIQFLKNNIHMTDFWALNDVSLSIQRGETFGIVGRNGAGKSTLLKVIARVISPTNGRVILHGKVVPLLELGAGFHPELTGRENIFLNAALLGHPQKETAANLPKIIEFAEVHGYIDAPLRTYSTGMVARLGFAIATFWQAEILILDEILAVGDEEFKTKCDQKLAEFKQNGSTIIMVSHNLSTIQEKCDHVAWIDRGKLKSIGNPQEVIQCYLEDIKNVEAGKSIGTP